MRNKTRYGEKGGNKNRFAKKLIIELKNEKRIDKLAYQSFFFNQNMVQDFAEKSNFSIFPLPHKNDRKRTTFSNDEL